MIQHHAISEHTAYGTPFITVDWSKKPRIEDVLSALETAAARVPASPEGPSVYAVGNLAVTPDDGPDILALCRAAEQQVNIWLVICADSQETLDLVYRTIVAINRAERIRFPLDAEDLRQTLACSSERGTVRVNAETYQALSGDGFPDTRGTVRVVSRVSACSAGWEGPVTEETSFIVVSAFVQETSEEEYKAFHHLLEQTSQYAAENSLILPICLSSCGDCFTQIFRSDVLFQTAPLTGLTDIPADDAFIVSLIESLWGDSSSN